MTVHDRERADRGVDRALEELRHRIAERIRFEQLRDQLTGLSNGAALAIAVNDAIEQEKQLWLAFVEVDRFKWINDKFGYQNADALLGRIADVLRSSEALFTGGATAYRPHGDEFYLIGEWSDDTASGAALLSSRLDQVRKNVADIRMKTDKGVVTCHVSIGWVETSSLQEALAARGAVLTYREIMSALELAVAEAKWERDRVVRYAPELTLQEIVSVRSDCPACRCKFHVSVPRARYVELDGLTCPTCRTPCARPPTTPPGVALE